MVRSVTLTFDNVVDRQITGAFALTDQAGVPINGVDLDVAGLGTTSLTITFSGSPIIGGSLADGKYRITVDGQSLLGEGRTVDAANTGTPGTLRQINFHRFFGDNDGDGDNDAQDFLAFRDTSGLSSGDPGFNSAFDFDNDGDVDAFDFLRFRDRFGSSV